MMKKRRICFEDFAEIFGILIVVFWLFCMFIPLIFDFQSASIVGKIFMIIGSVLYVPIYILMIGATKIQIEENDNVKGVWKKYCFYILMAVLYVFFLLRYFDINIWGTLTNVITIIFIYSVFFVVHYYIKKMKTIFNNEHVIMWIVAIAITLLYLGGWLKEEHTAVSLIMYKIAVGILYLIIVSVFINNALYMRENKDINKNKIFRLSFFILLGVTTLISFPFYIEWCGLSGEKLDTFVTTYSAVTGGGLTLMGVAWTINVQRKVDRKQAQRQYIPYMKLVDTDGALINAFCSEEIEQKKLRINVNKFSIKNISNNLIVLYSINIGEMVFNCQGDTVVEKGDIRTISICDEFASYLYIGKIIINCHDAIGNKYSINCFFDYESDNSYPSPSITYRIKYLDIPKLEN